MCASVYVGVLRFPQEELEWLGKRLESERTDVPLDELINMLDDENRGNGTGTHSDDEPSVILPQAPHPRSRSPRG